jgi:hypothetical protein
VLSLFLVTKCYSYSKIVLPLTVVTTCELLINVLPIRTPSLVTNTRDNIDTRGPEIKSLSCNPDGCEHVGTCSSTHTVAVLEQLRTLSFNYFENNRLQV